MLIDMNDRPTRVVNAFGEPINAFGDALLEQIECANPSCGKQFKPRRYWQKFCSVSCRNQEYWSRHKRLTVPIT
jgi:hypothetical protein